MSVSCSTNAMTSLAFAIMFFVNYYFERCFYCFITCLCCPGLRRAGYNLFIFNSPPKNVYLFPTTTMAAAAAKGSLHTRAGYNLIKK